MRNKAMEQYLNALKRALRCPQPERSRLLSRGRALLENFWEENPEADYEALITAFGPPEMFAGEMLDTLDQDKLTQTRSRQKWVMGSVVALAAVMILALVVTLRPAQPEDNDIPPFIYGVEYPYFYIVNDTVDDSDDLLRHQTIGTNMPAGVILSLLDLESVSAVGDPYFRVVDDPDDPTRRVIQTNLPPEAVHFLLHPEQSSEP